MKYHWYVTVASTILKKGFSSGSDSKEYAWKVGDLGLIPGSQRSPGGGHGYPLSTLAWKTPWTEKPTGLQAMGSERVGHNWLALFSCSLLELPVWQSYEMSKCYWKNGADRLPWCRMAINLPFVKSTIFAKLTKKWSTIKWGVPLCAEAVHPLGGCKGKKVKEVLGKPEDPISCSHQISSPSPSLSPTSLPISHPIL